MAQGEFWVERQNWARWPRVLKVNRHTERGTETRRYLPERHEAAWNEREYAVGKIAELEAENAELRELVRDMWDYAVNREMELCNACSCADGDFADCSACDEYDGACGIAKKRFEELYADRMRELGIEATP